MLLFFIKFINDRYFHHFMKRHKEEEYTKKEDEEESYDLESEKRDSIDDISLEEEYSEEDGFMQGYNEAIED